MSGGKLCAVGKKQGSQKDFVSTKDFWEKVEEPKRIRWTKQRGDESAAVEKLSKMFYANFSGTANGGAD